ncbi:RHS repeat-associated core domain-containing protein, partial [Chryseobacterium sp.]|uniref:RHS repeat domain-containing protein n=1 Tax=Chryseobacterium sp. TaxID=1871047 RepID=UPI0025B8F8FA
NGKLQFVPTDEGYYDFVQNKYIYNYTDHLGNIRLSYFKGNSGGAEIIEENNYYPFGLKHQGYNTIELANPAYKYTFNGQELQETGMTDFGARMYMNDLGRWGVIDPLAAMSRRFSPFAFGFNNPIRFIDPDGRQGTDWVHNRETNQIYWNPNATSQASAGANETYLGKSGTYTAQDGSTTYLFSNGNEHGYTNNSLIGGLGIAPNLDPLIHAGDSAPMMSVAAFGVPNNGSYIRETPSLNTQEGAFANPSAQLASTVLTAMQEAPLAIGGEIAVAKIGQAFNYLTKGGPTFAEYRAAYWAKNTKPVLEALENPLTGQTWKQTMELHHKFIPQRAKWAPNWLLNNKINLQPLNSLEHAISDPYRARFAPKWVKETYNLNWK